MKIIFDNEEQKNKFIFMTKVCPSEFGLEEHCSNTKCDECWEKAAELEVENETE